MGAFRFLWDVMQKSAAILNTRTSFPPREILLTYLKLKWRQALLSKILKGHITSETIFGFRVHFFDYSMFLYLFEEVFIKQEYHFICPVPDPIIFDCGSNIGLAVLYFKKLYPQSTILAFEPDRATFAVLKKNIDLNTLPNVHAHNKAVSGTEGMIDFYYDPGHPGWPRMSMQKQRMSSATDRVESITLSSFIDENVDFVKMDIEGTEFAVVEELASQKKLGSIRELVIEYHHHIKPEKDTLSEMLSVLEENGFGYQLAGTASGFFDKRALQDILIRAYRKG